MYDQFYRQALFGTALLELAACIGLALALWWMWRSIALARSSTGGRLQLALSGGLVLVILLAIVGLAVFAVAGLPLAIELFERRDAGEAELAALIDHPAPHLRFTGVADERSYHLTDFQGQVALVNLWATWCRPCRGEMAALERLQRELGGRGLVVIHLSDEPRATLSGYLEQQQPANLHVYAESTQWPSYALPTTYLVDREGLVRDLRTGQGSYEEFAAMVEPHL